MSNLEQQSAESERRHLSRPPTDAFGETAISGKHAERDVWLGATLAREERLTRLLSYGSLFFGLVAPLIGVGALILKLAQG